MKYGLAFLAVLVFCWGGAARAADISSQHLLIVGGGGVTGFYYPAAGSICRFVNLTRKQSGLRCLVESTGGSISNLQALKEGDIDLAVVQSNWLYHAVKGSNVFLGEKPNQDLRVLFSLHGEPLTIFAREAAGISKLSDLKKKRINLGRKGTAQRLMTEALIEAMGWTPGDFKAALELGVDEQMEALCQKKIDAAFYVIAHPISIGHEAAKCGARFLAADGPEIEALTKRTPYFTQMLIPPGMYPELPEGLATFGVKAMLVASNRLSEDLAHAITKAVFDNFDRFRHQHPVLEYLKKEELAKDPEVAPFHEGARRYFLAAGLAK